MGFVTGKGKDLSAGDVLYLAKEGSVGIKGKVFGTLFVNYLVIIIFFAIFFGLPVFLGLNFYDEEDYVAIFVNIIDIILFLAFIFVDIFVLSFFRLSVKISLYSIFFDNVEAKHVIIAKRGNEKDQFVPLFSDDKEALD